MSKLSIYARARLAYSAFHGATESGTRTTVHDFPLDPDKELPTYDRHQLVKKCRLLRNNLGFVRRLFEVTARYSVGGGLIPYTATLDKTFNKAADSLFEKVATDKDLDVSGQHDFYSMLKPIVSDTACDGEVFALKVKEKGYYPHQLQLIASSSVDSGYGKTDFVEGVRYDPVRRPLEYRVMTTDGYYKKTEPNDYRANHVLHIFDRNRLGLRRGRPWIHHGVNSSIDIIDTIALEKQAFKLNSYFAGVITTPTGEHPDGMKANIPGRGKANNVSDSGAMRIYKKFFGGAAIPVLKDGEKFEFFGNKRDAASIADFFELLIRDISLGFGPHPEFSYSMIKSGGAPSRFVIDDAGWFFEDVARMAIASFCQPFREWVIANALADGSLRLGSDPDWKACRWRGPRKVTADKKYDGNLHIALLKAGLMTEEEYWSMFGMDAEVMRRKRVDEIAEDMAYCRLRGVPYGLFTQSAPGTPLVDEEIPPQV